MVGKTIAKNLIEKYNPKSVLFCPYKEEMWDTMKTIYDALSEVEDLAVGIMPIPYYTLQNGRITDLKVEFGDYKNGFPMKLKRKWDIIIFHYPYDNLNNVTRPLLYSNELKAFCKHLVLVGYAVVGDRLPLLEELVYPGVKNSELVIFETEAQAAKANELLKEHSGWNVECVGWGSAKYDMVELAEIPMEWQTKGMGKKKILLQTSLRPFLVNRNKLNQIDNIVSNYLKNPYVCLIWRPHPLLRDTIIAHHQNELRRYDLLVDMVKRSQKDIFDETPTPESSIRFADEMISDFSSMTYLWKRTGKKITILE